jgi:hypothetical protein
MPVCRKVARQLGYGTAFLECAKPFEMQQVPRAAIPPLLENQVGYTLCQVLTFFCATQSPARVLNSW